MTARLPEEPVRVTNWLAGWLDYVYATVMTAGRWFRLPVSRRGSEPVMMAAFAPAMADGYGPHWQDSADEAGSGRVIRLLEIGMLSVSFFLAAHLLSGGTPTVAAPNMNPFQAGNHRAQAAALAIPGAAGKEVLVNAGAFASNTQAQAVAAEPALPVDDAAAAATLETQAAAIEEIAVLAPADAPNTDAAAVSAPAPEPDPVPAAVEPEPAPAPPAAAVPIAEAAVPLAEDRYLSTEELRTAALAAGWPAELIPELETVAWCESRYHTHARYLGALGLMQMMPFWFVEAGLNMDLWHDPVTNLRAAKYAYDNSISMGVDGWGPWTCKP